MIIEGELRKKKVETRRGMKSPLAGKAQPTQHVRKEDRNNNNKKREEKRDTQSVFSRQKKDSSLKSLS